MAANRMLASPEVEILVTVVSAALHQQRGRAQPKNPSKIIHQQPRRNARAGLGQGHPHASWEGNRGYSDRSVGRALTSIGRVISAAGSRHVNSRGRHTSCVRMMLVCALCARSHGDSRGTPARAHKLTECSQE
jgi:hypothetical protein